jgi:hypothetical protein
MTPLRQGLEDAPGDAILALDRLIRIGVRADGDRRAAIASRRQLLFQQPRRVRLVEQLGLEIEPGREIQVRVRRPGITINATVLAAAIRIDRLVERNVRRLIATDDRARRLGQNRRP